MDDGKVTITIEIDAELLAQVTEDAKVLWPHAGRSRGAVLQILCPTQRHRIMRLNLSKMERGTGSSREE